MIHRVQRTIDGKDLILETGELAMQAGGSVKVQYGETIVLATATMSNSAREGVDFLPLSVDIEERHYAIGKIPGSFFRREGRPTTEAVLGSRVTDRTIRPLIPKKIRNEIQVLLTVLSADRVNPHDTIALVGASAALTISNVPFDGPVSATRVGYIDGELVTNLTYENLADTDLDLVVAGSENAIVMVEGGAQEVDETIVLDALKKAQEVNHEIIQMQQELADLTSKEKTVFEEDESDDSFAKELEKLIVITRGEKGSIAINKDEVVEYEIQKNLKIVDLTGAGDLFAAGFLHGHINNLSIKESLQKGTEMSTRVIQKIGARL